MSEPFAPEGKIYVCTACGKTARGLYGTKADYGWDESCMLNAVLANESDLVRENGRVIQVNGPVEKT